MSTSISAICLKGNRTISNDTLCVLVGATLLGMELNLSSNHYNIIYVSDTVLIDNMSFKREDLMNKLKITILTFFKT